MRRASGRRARPGGRRPDAAAGPGRGATLAVAVNGRIEAVGRSFHLDGDPREHYSVMVPEATLHDGRNRVEVFEVPRGGTPAPARARS